jgi:hypothetical protein
MPKVIGFDPVDLGYGGMINYSGSDNNKVLDDVKDGDYPTPGNSFRYIRLEIVTGSYFEVKNLRFIASLTRYPTVNMTSNTEPSPLVASASSTHLSMAQFQPYKAFDGDAVNTRWHSTVGGSHWIQIDLGTGNEIRPNSLAMIIFSGSGDRRPTSLIVKGSNTGAFSGEDETLYTSASGVESLFEYNVETVIDF